MKTDHTLTLTVEQAAEVLGIGRSTDYELVRTGDLKHIRLRRRIVVPVAHLAERLGVDRDSVWGVLATSSASEPALPPGCGLSSGSTSHPPKPTTIETPSLL